MKVMILGIDGYIGWALALREISKGNDVSGVDNFFTRKRVSEVNSDTVMPIPSMQKRISLVREKLGRRISFHRGDVANPRVIMDAVKAEKPDVIVHLAEQRSAPYSMIGLRQATQTMVKNVVSTLNLIYAVKDFVPDAHILKLGTMGEYGTPNIDIPEGFFEIEYHGRKDFLPFPKQAGSWYHWTKVHDSNNLMFANRVWKLRITDVMQGVVYGTRTKEITETAMNTRFDIDEVWGTALNRFCAQAMVGMPMTPYGKGQQRRGFLSLEDSISCLDLAIEKPPEKGEYRVFNQFDEHYSVMELAKMVKEVFEREYGKEAVIKKVPNPRVEAEDHYYNPEHVKLAKMGYRRSRELKDEISTILADLSRYKSRIESLREVINPRTRWEESRVN